MVNFFNPNFTPQITKQSRGKVRVKKVNLRIYWYFSRLIFLNLNSTPQVTKEMLPVRLVG